MSGSDLFLGKSQMKRIRVIFCVIIFMTGLGIASYPFISNMVAQRHASQVVKDYETNVEEMDEENDYSGAL